MKFSFLFKFKELTVKKPIAITSVCEIDNNSKCSKCNIYMKFSFLFKFKELTVKKPIAITSVCEIYNKSNVQNVLYI